YTKGYLTYLLYIILKRLLWHGREVDKIAVYDSIHRLTVFSEEKGGRPSQVGTCSSGCLLVEGHQRQSMMAIVGHFCEFYGTISLTQEIHRLCQRHIADAIKHLGVNPPLHEVKAN